MWRRKFQLRLVTALGLALCAGTPQRAAASCNQIPGITNNFRSTAASLDRPFAAPGDLVEVRLSPVCDAGRTFTTTPLVSVVFTPPEGPRSIVAVAADCAALQDAMQQCRSQPGVGTVACVAGNVQVLDPQRLRFPFPDTDPLVGSSDDDRTLSGPATIAVSASGAPLPCGLGSSSCAQQPGTLACVDTLFTIDGSCGTTPDAQFSHFTALPPPNDYQALCINPSPPCSGRAEELRFTIDRAGNILLPMDWRGILAGRSVPIARLLRGSTAVEAFAGSGQPIRIPSQAFLHSFSFEGGVLPPIFEPQSDPSSSRELTLFGSADAPQTVLWIGRRSPTHQACSAGPNAGEPCSGQADECGGGNCGAATCVGGANAGQVCKQDADCPDSECGRTLFDFRSRFTDGIGPVLIARFAAGVCQDSGTPCGSDQDCAASRCVAYRFEARDSVPLDGLIESPDVLVSVVPEAVEGRDLNGDGDHTDDVLLLSDRRTGQRTMIGLADAPGRAATRLQQRPFSYPAVSVEDGIVAFLEAEPLQGYYDANGDGDRFDAILRVFQHSDNDAVDLTTGLNLAIDAAPLVNRQSVVVSQGLVYFRRPEVAGTRRVLTRIGDAPARNAALSSDGRQVAVERADATYVHDLHSGAVTRLVLRAPQADDTAPARSPWLSEDGRYVAVSAPDTSGVEQIFLHDRDTDGNGIFDEPQRVATLVLTTNVAGDLGDLASTLPFVTPGGQYVSFLSQARNLIEGTPNRLQTERTWIRDVGANPADTNALSLASRGWQTSLPTEFDDLTERPSLSADGRAVAFSSFDSSLVPGDSNDFCLSFFGTHFSTNCSDVFVYNRLSQRNERVSVGTNGEQANSQSLSAFISAAGNQVGFESFATNLVAGDTNSVADVFVHDRHTKITARVSVASDGTQANGPSLDRNVALSADGRFVVFGSTASNLVPGDTNDSCRDPLTDQPANCSDIFLHDQLTGWTQRLSVASHGAQGDADSVAAALSADGSVVAFESSSTTLTSAPSACGSAEDGASCNHVFVSAPDTSQPGADLNGDGSTADTFLQVFNTATSELRTICPAQEVGVAGPIAAFLRPEWAGNTAGCPGGDLNGDGDHADLVVHLLQADGRVENLGKAATAVLPVYSGPSLAVVLALVSEADQAGTDLNGDGDTADTVAAVYNVVAPDPGWSNLGQAADSIAGAGDLGVLLSSEAAQGEDLNGDGDLSDRVPQIVSLPFRTIVPLVDAAGRRYAAEDVVIGSLRATGGVAVAFRSREANGPHADCDLNGDGDCNDDVLLVRGNGLLLNTAQAVIPCRFEACDPRLPYRVLNDTVKFLTLEADQGEDLNGDGDSSDLVLQSFNFAAALATQPRSRRGYKRTVLLDGAVRAEVLTTIGAISAGLCTDSGRACATPADCGAAATCFVPPGGCVRDLGIDCDPTGRTNECGAERFCVPADGDPGVGHCHALEGECARDADCTAPASCVDAGQSFQRLVSPLAGGAAGAQVFVSAGSGAELIVAAASDVDGDEVADPFDNCPRIANVEQRDGDGDGVGDACQSAVQVTPPATATVTVAPPTATATRVTGSSGDHGSCAVGARVNGDVIGLLWAAAAVALLRAVRRRASR